MEGCKLMIICRVRDFTNKGWLRERLLPPFMQVFWKVRDVISGSDSIFFKGDCIIPPKSICQTIELAHSGHQAH